MAEKEQRSEGQKKSSKMLIIIVIVVMALVLVGGAAAAYFLMGRLTTDAVENTEQALQKPELQPATAETFYYDISKPLIVDFPRGSSVRLIQVSVSLLVEGRATLEALKKHDPMIRNNLLMLISAKGADSLSTREGKDQLRADILGEAGAVLEKMTSENHVKEVFFTAFVMQ